MVPAIWNNLLKAEDDARKVAILLNQIGNDSDLRIIDVHNSFGIDIDKVKYGELIKLFEHYFKPKKNTTISSRFK